MSRTDRQPPAATGAAPTRPGWPEIVVGLVAFLLATAVVPFFGPLGLKLEPVPFGLILTAWSGVVGLVLTFVLLSVLTPIGEEFLFRGVIANALLRYGPVIGVLASAVIFALCHGTNLALPTALVVGIIAAEIMRRSGSIWPAVVVHAVNNLGLPLFVLITGATGPA
ncbi:CPBP family intramembrane glutamic endopeptidase [Microlunatus speluncae]|uniref:CPBP family intramembrane glutamic endopeptidase n=1 Tax=Microlunatus speluncae TaxID=2594267 RepID=UPI001C2D48E5|nr:CPBP family intramembrane glutamic endopeptidase [Microlunatus speluncae]